MTLQVFFLNFFSPLVLAARLKRCFYLTETQWPEPTMSWLKGWLQEQLTFGLVILQGAHTPGTTISLDLSFHLKIKKPFPRWELSRKGKSIAHRRERHFLLQRGELGKPSLVQIPGIPAGGGCCPPALVSHRAAVLSGLLITAPAQHFLNGPMRKTFIKARALQAISNLSIFSSHRPREDSWAETGMS